MQLLMIILMAAVLLPLPSRTSTASTAFGVVGIGMALLVLTCVILAFLLRRSLRGPRPDRAIRRAARAVRVVQCLAVSGIVASVVGLGFLGAVRSIVGDLPLIDEMIVVSPALVVIVIAWWIFHPFERRLQESILLRRLDEGEPIGPMPGRSSWVVMQIRLQMMVILIPIALLAVVSEAARLWLDTRSDPPMWLWYGVLIGAMVPIALLAPWLMVRIMGARPMPAGEIRESLERMCESVGVRVRDLMLWPTGGTLVNAAVTGLVARARWVLMTDGLLDTLPRPQILAVMAHELGHARLRHMPWMALAVVSMSLVLGILFDLLLEVLHARWVASTMDPDRSLLISHAIDGVGVAVLLASILLVFGWVSRRFERQADAFAAIQVTRRIADSTDEVVAPGGVDAMCSALLIVARTNGVSPRRFSWRHGSIDSRCRHLRSLVGRAFGGLPVDREVAWIKIVSVAASATSLGWWTWRIGGEAVAWSS